MAIPLADLLRPRSHRMERHITWKLKRAQEGHQTRFVPTSNRLTVVTDVALSQRVGLHLEVDLGVNIGGVQRSVPKPPPDRVDVNAGTKQMAGCCMANGVRTDPLVGHRGRANLCLARAALTKVWMPKWVIAQPRRLRNTGSTPARSPIRSPSAQCARPQRTVPHLPAFAQDANGRGGDVDVPDLQFGGLVCARARIVEKQEQHVLPASLGSTAIRRGKQCIHFRLIEIGNGCARRPLER